MLTEIRQDLRVLRERFGNSNVKNILTNRGFHALAAYRFSHFLANHKLGLFSQVITRIIQILYGIDIDYRCRIDGGVAIVHGTGLVVGSGVHICHGVLIYHQVTLGIRGTPANDGFPVVRGGSTLGAGCKVLGPVEVGAGCTIGANAVITRDVAPFHFATSVGKLITKKLSDK